MAFFTLIIKFKEKLIWEEDKFDFIQDKYLSQFPFNLHLHALEDEGRTEDPTEHRKRKAREDEGRVFFSNELPQGTLLLITFSTLLVLSYYYNNLLKEMFVTYLGESDIMFFSLSNVGLLLLDVVWLLTKFIIPIGLVGILVIVISTMIQTGFHVSTKQLKWNVNKIIPTWNNFKKKTIFSKSQLLNSLKIFFKILVIGVVSYFILFNEFANLSLLVNKSISESYRDIAWLVYKLVIVISIITVILAIPDWFMQKSEFEESLKMTKEEIKQEYKELEGDPMIKSRIRERAREIANSEMITNVKTADVVVTNPTHFACAIKYSLTDMDAPKLVAKGQDHLALKIREVAKGNEIPIVENKPLARSLYANVEVDQFVPVEYYSAIAQILAALDKYKDEVA